jgi:hypothetical protein
MSSVNHRVSEKSVGQSKSYAMPFNGVGLYGSKTLRAGKQEPPFAIYGTPS